MIYNLAEQGSDAWLAARRGKITGSKFKDARARLADKVDKKTGEITRGLPSAKCISYAHDVARERVGGKPAAVYQNGAMRMGTEQEPFARQAYETVTGYLVQEVGFATTDCGTFGLSLDGRVAPKGAVEIKTMVSSETLFSAVVDGDISEYEDQCHGAILFLDLDWIDLVLWTPDLEEQGLGLVIKRIERDEVKLAELKADLDAFAALVNEFEAQLRSKAAANIKALNQQQPETTEMQPEENTPEPDPALEPLAQAATETVAFTPPTQADFDSGVVDAEVKVDGVVLTGRRVYIPLKIMSAPAAAPELKLGQMAERLGFTLTAAFLLELGFEHSATDKAAKLYHESEWPLICAALIKRIENACELQAA